MVNNKTAKPRLALPGGKTLDLERRFSYRFSMLVTKVVRCVAEMYSKKYSLLPSGWKVMAVIGRFGQAFGTDVCLFYTSVEPHKVTRAVDRLVQLGYVKREQDAADGRRVVLSLTTQGWKVYADIDSLTRRVERELQKALSKQELKDLDRILEKLEKRAITSKIGDRNGWRHFTSAASESKS